MLGPRSMNSAYNGPASAPPLQRHRSTKQLITQYESMSSGPSTGQCSRSMLNPEIPPAVPKVLSVDSQRKNKSPIRQSLRNLLSVFKKSNARKEKQENERPLSSFRRQPVLGEFIPSLVHRSQSRKLTSTLLYLCHSPVLSSFPCDLPVWMFCRVTLESDSIVISCGTPHENPFNHIIQLSNCTDVRSLSVQQLDTRESTLLPRRNETEEFKIFEILFEGRPREKFATNSVQERAGWISAVWDTILPSQDTLLVASNELFVEGSTKSLPASKDKTSHGPERSEFTQVPPLMERSLPPIPTASTTGILPYIDTSSKGWSRTSKSPSIRSSTEPVFGASYGINSRPVSPSVANLSKLSVVRQRLAQIEPSSSQSSFGGLTSPTASHSTRLATPVMVYSDKGLTSSLINMSRQQSSGADSILDSYGAVHTWASAEIEPPLDQAGHGVMTDNTIPTCLSSSAMLPRYMQSVCSSLKPSVDTLHVCSPKNCGHTVELCNQVLSMQNYIQALPQDIASAIGMETHTRTVLDMVAKLEEQARANGNTLGSITSKLDAYMVDRPTGGNANLAHELHSFRKDISEDLFQIRALLKPAGGRAGGRTIQVMNNLPNSNAEAAVVLSNLDLSGLHAKLDDIVLASKSAVPVEDGNESSRLEMTRVRDTLTRVMTLLEQSQTQQSVRFQQQVESTRYLHELNSWLETFVNSGTSQIQSLVASIDQLRQNLGALEGDSTLFADIHQLALDATARDHGSTSLHVTLDGLLVMLKEQSASNNIACITTMIDRQRQDHEGMLQFLTTEISNEIKGERLRFVEAMKEATAINVQVHVEQFKKELKREVVGMTEEVGRLHQDRQAMQNQIADLFAFYRRQKAVGRHVSGLYLTSSEALLEHDQSPDDVSSASQ